MDQLGYSLSSEEHRPADLIAYQTSKHAVLGLLHGAAMYGGPLGIRVNAVAPGIIESRPGWSERQMSTNRR